MAVSPDAAMFASVGWDGFLKLWSLSEDHSTGEPVVKKSKRAVADGLQSKVCSNIIQGSEVAQQL